MADPKLLADVAWKFYRRQPRMTEKEIAIELGSTRKQPYVARLLAEARAKGVVAFDIDPKFAIGGSERDSSYVRDLQETFHLKNAVVVDLPKNTSSDDLHIALANHAGRRAIATIEENDHICVAGGRTIVQLARYIGRNPPPKKNLTISPLGGRLWTGSWQIGGPAHLEYPLDADDSAFLLYVAFMNEPGTRFSQISLPVFAHSSREAKTLIRGHCAALPDGTWNWKLGPGTRAYVGVGALDASSGHRISEFLDQSRLKHGKQKRRDAPYLGRAAKDLRDTIAFARATGLPAFGDIGNRLFAAVPRPQQLAAHSKDVSRAFAKVARVLAALNERSVTFQWQHLHATPVVNVIAGSKLKVDQLWSVLLLGLLHPEKKLCTELTTDSEAADALIAAHRDFEGAPREVQEWYTRILPRLFPAPRGSKQR
jgi:DNA-binding transcriptional regulator LsrR (DeoR family)